MSAFFFCCIFSSSPLESADKRGTLIDAVRSEKVNKYKKQMWTGVSRVSKYTVYHIYSLSQEKKQSQEEDWALMPDWLFLYMSCLCALSDYDVISLRGVINLPLLLLLVSLFFNFISNLSFLTVHLRHWTSPIILSNVRITELEIIWINIF